MIFNDSSNGIVPTDKVPLLEYKFPVTTTKPDGVELIDYGKGHSNGKLYFGRGVKFNGVDQMLEIGTYSDYIFFRDQDYTVIVEKISDVNSYLVWLGSIDIRLTGDRLRVWNGISNEIVYGIGSKTVTLTYQASTSTYSIYVNGVFLSSMIAKDALYQNNGLSVGGRPNIGYGTGVVKNIQIFGNIVLTPDQIAYQYSHPEKFLYSVATTQTDGSKTYTLNSEILTQEEIDSVVAYLPMCETDDYVRDMVGYSEGANQVVAVTVGGTDTTYTDGVGHLVQDGGSDHIAIGSESENGSYYLIQYTVLNCDCSIQDKLWLKGFDLYAWLPTAIGGHSIVYKATSNTDLQFKLRDVDDGGYIDITNISVKKLTSTHQITNFTNSCRDEALHLAYGLQTCFLQRDELGVPSGSSFDRLQVNAEKCPLYFSLTDAELHEANNGNWQIEMVLNREYVNDITDKTFDSIAIDSDGNLTGLLLMFNKSWDSRYCTMYFYKNDSNTCSYQSFKIIEYGDNVSLHLVFQHYDDNTHELFLNGDSVSGKKTSGFVPSGNSLVNLYQNIFNGELRLFKVHTTPQDTAELYSEAVRKGLLDD